MILFNGELVPEIKDASERKTQFRKKGKVDAAMAGKIAEMYNGDYSYEEIAKECGISKTTVGQTIKKFRRCKKV